MTAILGMTNADLTAAKRSDPDADEQSYCQMVTAQVAPARNLLTRDSAYESTYP